MVGVMVLAPLPSTLLGPLFKILTSSQVKNLFAKEETFINKLKTVLHIVNEVLIDAEEKQMTNPEVKEWFNKLKHAAYDADDLLDDVATAALKRETKIASNYFKGKAKVRASTLNPFHDAIKERLKNIIERLENLANWRDLLNLKGSELPVIAIVGIPGVGKTTLSQLLYNDLGVMERFDEFRAWAYVSEDSDVFKITRTIFNSVNLTDYNVTSLNVVQVRLKTRLSGRRFLFVLDDIWNENLIDRQLLLTPLKVGAFESRIIVTTSNISVASIMQAVVTHHLSHLLDEECWSLFAKHASMASNPNEHTTLKRIGGKIVEKCKGLPLAAKTLGGLLQSEVEADEWHNILNSKIWDLPIDKSSILPALRLSYYHLPPHLKRCFAYCSIFPKSYEFKKRNWFSCGW